MLYRKKQESLSDKRLEKILRKIKIKYLEMNKKIVTKSTLSQVALIVICSCFILSCASRKKITTQHVILISLDGVKPEFYMDTSYHAFNLKKLMDGGIYSSEGAKSVFPSITYPAHTSIITGNRPMKHGIFFNKPPFDKDPKRWYWETDLIKSKTLWQAVREKGKTSGSVLWPVSVGAPVDYNFPSRNPQGEEKENILDIKKLFATPQNLLEEIESSQNKTFNVDDLSHDDFALSKTVSNIAEYIIKNHKPDLVTLRFTELDYALHKFGVDSKEVKDAIVVTDSLVGAVVDAVKLAGIKDNTTIIIVGDHGHVNTEATFYPNFYLHEAGFLNGDTKDWKAFFVPAGGSAFLYLRDGDQYLDSIVNVLKKSKEYAEGMFSIIDKKSLQELGSNTDAGLAISMKEGISVGGDHKGQSFKQYDLPHGSTHGYDPDYHSMHTAFIAAGSGIKQKGDVKNVEIVDVAPLIANLLDLSMPDTDGKFNFDLNKKNENE